MAVDLAANNQADGGQRLALTFKSVSDSVRCVNFNLPCLYSWRMNVIIIVIISSNQFLTGQLFDSTRPTD